MIAHHDQLQDVLKELGTDPKTGLSASEATSRLAKYGPNKLKEKKKKTNLQRFIEQFKDTMILILLAAAAVSFGVSISEGHAPYESLLILAIVIVNAIIGVMQENKAEKALDALKNLTAPKSRVVRDGKEMVIDAVSLVPGDIIVLDAGDMPPADARLIESANMRSDESALTGESVAAEKNANAHVVPDAALGDRFNMVYSGCSISYGRGRAVVTGTGMETEMGKIASLLSEENELDTPLQQKLAQLGKSLGIMALIACAVIFVIGIIDDIPVLEMFMTSVSLAVSAIPEGLPAIVTVVLAIGVQRMVKRNAIVRRLPAVETLGSASVICSDKTGTLTQNRMTLTKAYAASVDALENITTSNSEAVRALLQYSSLCCDGKIEIGSDGTEHHIGDPTETAIVLAAHRNGLTQKILNEKYPRLSELPFDSERKLMTTVNSIDGKNIVIVKGAFDVLAERVVSGDVEKARKVVDALSSDALRVLGVAYKVIDTVPEQPTSDELENGLTFMGLVGMIDPPRPEVRDAVSLCKKAGIKVVMITGDHVATAQAIAKDLGIMAAGDEAVTGKELAAMSNAELDKRVRHISVYARVSPTDKIRIVKAWQEQGEVVAMTGDGVNDAPALKAADIGCAMGITGTDVAKGAAAMTLTDDNFSTIVHAVREGRGIFDNIKKVVSYLLSCNIGEVLTVFFAMLIWRQTPLLSMQLLWINLITDSLPAISLGVEPVEKDVMDRKPKSRSEGIFANGLGLQLALQGTMLAILTLIAFYLGGGGTEGGIAGGRTMAFMVLSMSQFVQSFNMKSARSLFKVGVRSNPNHLLAVAVSATLLALVLFVPPLTRIFELTALTGGQYLMAVGLALFPFPVLEIAKAFNLARH
ncbi:calcium-translocating P-type ATPase, PMCA-type [Parasphaerochaeta coccoides]|uniref:P-type Ca(2+) transporter n=1 Tax=Parasphaerochaeta coccoides (strain ATCC BAA-1237 / DSM 17374 / SPN1) TaxID=760011 RepID=F4GKF2_PARC1|nr:calcium-translocating P-type ATPase, PMCA-type [Parasphaerochaeta coccoides]AEC02835.1 calcium-translocating P-type ATPase, PMCA-type [Parasphaerochaeta coccoides DSM 17374]